MGGPAARLQTPRHDRPGVRGRGRGAGFWKAIRDVFPDTKEQRCWWHKIESTFATVRLRTRVTKGPGSRAAGVGMAFKLIESAQARWRAVNAPHLVALVRAGAMFENGKLIERPESDDDSQAA